MKKPFVGFFTTPNHCLPAHPKVLVCCAEDKITPNPIGFLLVILLANAEFPLMQFSLEGHNIAYKIALIHKEIMTAV